MNRPATKFSSISLASLFGFMLAGCSPQTPPPSAVAKPSVAVSQPVERVVTDYAGFTARLSAVDSVEVRARVDGYLDSVHFKAGSLVKKGDVLFVIDQRPYVRELNRSQAQLEQAHAEYQHALTKIESAQAAKMRAEADLENTRGRIRRAAPLLSKGAMHQEEFDERKSELSKAEADVRSAGAGIESAKSAVELAKAAEESARAGLLLAELNLDYTTVKAPVSGRISRNLVSTGNLIQAGQSAGGTVLTTIVSVDPVYAYFDVDERTVLRVKQLIREGKAEAADDVKIPVEFELADEAGRHHRGTINFIDNQVNPRTGTLKVRGVFPNQDEALLPGFFGRVRVPIGAPHSVLLITERAIDTDQGQKIVYVVNGDSRAVARPVRLGAFHDALREITDGLKPGERVIVNGQQKVRSGLAVEPNMVPMPASKTGAASTPVASVDVATKP